MLPFLLSLALASAPQDSAGATPSAGGLALDDLRAAGAVLGLEFTDPELEGMLPGVVENLRGYGELRATDLENALAAPFVFTPRIPGVAARAVPLPGVAPLLPAIERPLDLEELAFADIATLASLIRSRQVSCVELTEMSLARLERLNAKLHNVITLMPERALAQARELDAELEEGKWRGPLHGIPWGAKDLLAVPGYPTTWGAKPYVDQLLDEEATVVTRLDRAGAVLVAKLTLGALAWGDVWFGGTTRNPWKPEEGSSGSSAGSASAVAAGGVVFSIGSETLGSIVSPSQTCGNSSLRPTFGRVSRHGAMALSWSMDKLGPLCRSVEDAALVLEAIAGADPLDPQTVPAPFARPGRTPVEGWKIGYPRAAPPDETLRAELELLGLELVPIEVPSYSAAGLLCVLFAESAAAFDELTRSGRDDELVRQGQDTWPNAFRTARLIPAVEYLRANRLRSRLMRDTDAAWAEVAAVVHGPYDAGILTLSNLTGHPTVVAPRALGPDGTPDSVCFTGQLYDEGRLVALARAWQEATQYHRVHPQGLER